MKKQLYILLSATMLCAMCNANETPSVNEETKMDNEIYTHECTSWLVFSELTKNNTNILHKNRDAEARDLTPLISSADSPRKWIGLGNVLDEPSKINVCMGINASGLAIVVNSGEKSVEHSSDDAKMGTPAILRSCLEECDTAKQSVEKLRGFLSSQQYSHGDKGSIFLFMDMKEAIVAELTSKRISLARYDHGFAYRANIWHNADMAQYADNSISFWLNSSNREFMVIQDMNKALRTKGKVEIGDMLEMSRDAQTPEESSVTRTICSKSTNSASTLEINLTYPDVLSTGYFLVGPPRNTICIPVPICIDDYLSSMTSLEWSGAAWKNFEQNGFDAKLPSEWQEFETRSLAQYKAAQANAEKLLKEGRRDDAIKHLNVIAHAIWNEAEKLLLKR